MIYPSIPSCSPKLPRSMWCSSTLYPISPSVRAFGERLWRTLCLTSTQRRKVAFDALASLVTKAVVTPQELSALKIPIHIPSLSAVRSCDVPLVLGLLHHGESFHLFKRLIEVGYDLKQPYTLRSDVSVTVGEFALSIICHQHNNSRLVDLSRGYPCRKLLSFARVLLESGVNPNHVCIDKCSPLELAIRNAYARSRPRPLVQDSAALSQASLDAVIEVHPRIALIVLLIKYGAEFRTIKGARLRDLTDIPKDEFRDAEFSRYLLTLEGRVALWGDPRLVDTQ